VLSSPRRRSRTDPRYGFEEEGCGEEATAASTRCLFFPVTLDGTGALRRTRGCALVTAVAVAVAVADVAADVTVVGSS